jgi:hypothetical protein
MVNLKYGPCSRLQPVDCTMRIRSLMAGLVYSQLIRSARAFSAPAIKPARTTRLHKRILALDFDGVVCASDGESSRSAVIAAQRRWPNCPIKDSDVPHIQTLLSSLRPYIETGFEVRGY